jgi:hypothetical protein
MDDGADDPDGQEECAAFLVGQVAVLRSGAIGEAEGFLDQGGLASLKLSQELTHLDLQKQKPARGGFEGHKKTARGRLLQEGTDGSFQGRVRIKVSVRPDAIG